MKLLFISPRPIGLIATPGTYLAVEAYAHNYQCSIIAKPKTRDNEIIVHKPRCEYLIHVLDPACKSYLDSVKKIILTDDPNIICIASSPRWDDLVIFLHNSFPHKSIFLEIKSPTLIDDEQKLSKRQASWQSASIFLSGVIAPSIEMINSYIPKINIPYLIHKSIIDYNCIVKKEFQQSIVKCQRFIFTGSLGKVRKLDKFLYYISILPRDILNAITIDIFGDGPILDDLKELARSLSLDSVITFYGAIPQADLFKLYHQYDAGIAWVPSELFDGAPSLKLIEYCTAGLIPIATSTAGHKILSSYGLNVFFFDYANENSFAELMLRMVTKGVDKNILCQNIQKTSDFDYLNVIKNEIIPFHSALLHLNANPSNQHPLTPDDSYTIDKSIFRQWAIDSTIRMATTDNSKRWFDEERLLHAKRILTHNQ